MVRGEDAFWGERILGFEVDVRAPMEMNVSMCFSFLVVLLKDVGRVDRVYLVSMIIEAGCSR